MVCGPVTGVLIGVVAAKLRFMEPGKGGTEATTCEALGNLGGEGKGGIEAVTEGITLRVATEPRGDIVANGLNALGVPGLGDGIRVGDGGIGKVATVLRLI